jgi:hypothetical protein
MQKNYDDLDRRLTLVEQLVAYHHTDIGELWSQLGDGRGEIAKTTEGLPETAARFSVAAEIEARGETAAAPAAAAEAQADEPQAVTMPAPGAVPMTATSPAYQTAAPAPTQPERTQVASPIANASEASTFIPAPPAAEAEIHAPAALTSPAPQEAQATQMLQPIASAAPAAEEPKPASRFAGRKLSELLPTITAAEAHDFAAEAISRHPAGNAEASETAIALLEAVTANLVEEAPAEARTMDTLRSMAAQPDDGLKATFDTLAQGLRYDLASQAWVRSERAEEHPAIAPWSKYIAAGELQRMLGREAAENAIKEE